MTRKDIVIDDVLTFGWRVMEHNLGFFFQVVLIIGGVSMVFGTLQEVIEASTMGENQRALLIGMIGLVNQLLSWFLMIGFIRVGLSFCDQVKPPIETLFRGGDVYFRFIGANLLYGVIVLAGIFLLIIPGLIWAIQFQFAPFFVAEQGLSAVDALKASSRITQRVKWKLFGFNIMIGAIMMAGALCCGVGLIVAWPVVMVATALVSRHLIAQTPGLYDGLGGSDGFGMGGVEPGYGAGGGYGGSGGVGGIGGIGGDGSYGDDPGTGHTGDSGGMGPWPVGPGGDSDSGYDPYDPPAPPQQSLPGEYPDNDFGDDPPTDDRDEDNPYGDPDPRQL